MRPSEIIFDLGADVKKKNGIDSLESEKCRHDLNGAVMNRQVKCPEQESQYRIWKIL